MPEQEIPVEVATPLTDATTHLDTTIERLIEKLDIDAKLNRRTNRLARFATALGAVCVVLVVVVGLLYMQLSHQADTNTENAVTQCHNGNITRQASTAVWVYLIDASLAENPTAPAEAKRLLTDFERYVVASLSPQDCTHLNQPRTVPTPPTLPTGPPTTSPTPTHS